MVTGPKMGYLEPAVIRKHSVTMFNIKTFKSLVLLNVPKQLKSIKLAKTTLVFLRVIPQGSHFLRVST